MKIGARGRRRFGERQPRDGGDHVKDYFELALFVGVEPLRGNPVKRLTARREIVTDRTGGVARAIIDKAAPFKAGQD